MRKEEIRISEEVPKPVSMNTCTVKIHKPGIGEKLFFFASGMIIGVPVALVFEVYAGQFLGAPSQFTSFILAVALAPFIEEFAKVYSLFMRHGETQRSYAVLGFLLGLGFGVAEFMIYVFAVGASFWVRVPAVIFHASSTLIAAYGIVVKRILPYYLVAVFLHMSVNAVAYVPDPFWLIGMVAVLALTFLLAYRLYRKTQEKFVE
jgi:hypothetical protein